MKTTRLNSLLLIPALLVASALLVVVATDLAVWVCAQTGCTAGNTPSIHPNGRRAAWPQNVIVAVNVNAGQFTQTEFDNCVKPVFDNFNLTNRATGAGFGNFSGVQFSVTYGTNATASVSGTTASNAPGVSYGLQVNKVTTLPGDTLGRTFNGDNGTNRTSAVIDTNSGITDCTAIQMNLAHEIGHTFGLHHCGGTQGNCASQGVSIMNRATVCAVPGPNGTCAQADFNDTSYGRTAPSQCDNGVTQQAGQYDPNTLNPPCIDGDGDGWTSCNDCNDSQYDPYNSCGGQYCPEQQYPCHPGEWWSEYQCRCVCNPMYCTPILIDTEGDGFDLTDVAGGVTLDLTADGEPDRISWTAAGSDDAWLALDRDGNGRIDGGAELFGGRTEQPPSAAPNGFRALAEFDKPAHGGNGDGVIDRRDAVFDRLRLWRDDSHDGHSDPGELHALPALGVTELELEYRLSKRTDAHGNEFKYRAKVRGARGAQAGRWAWDVILLKAEASAP